MLRARRNINLESLGPPKRFADMEECEKADEASVQRQPLTRVPTPLSSATPRQTSHGKENVYQAGTPRDRPPSVYNRTTPNSTYPNSLCDSSGSIKKSVKLSGSHGQQTPSSTFPVSLPITGGQTQQNGVTEPESSIATETQQPTPHIAAEGKVQSSIANDHHQAVTDANTCDSVAATRDNRLPNSSSCQSVIHKSKSVPHHLEAGGVGHGGVNQVDGHLITAQRNLLPSKLNIDQGMTRRASEDRGILASAAPALRLLKHESDIVTLTSATGEKRFKRLKLLGCGGSSKVSMNGHTHLLAFQKF